MSERKLATIRKIAEVRAIENADKIQAYRVDGWWIIDAVDKYKVDDLVTYLEIDSFVPHELAPFLSKGKEPREFEGVKGERLRTIKLKGQVSQGLLLPVKGDGPSGVAYHIDKLGPFQRESGRIQYVVEGDDVTDALGIVKYEKPLPAQLAGMAKGNFPSFIPKTDQERIQNLGKYFEELKAEHTFEVTEKLNGSSMTVYVNGDESGVCSRNLDLKFQESNSFWEAAVKYDLIAKIKSTGRNLAIQGELIGEGIQGNSYKLQGRDFYCFDIFDIDTGKYLLPEARQYLCNYLGIKHVPVLEKEYSIKRFTIEDILKLAEFTSVVGVHPQREGLVFKSNSVHDASFKVISNKWLLKGGD